MSGIWFALLTWYEDTYKLFAANIYVYMYIHIYLHVCLDRHTHLLNVSLVHLLRVLRSDSDIWTDADLESVVTYLRGSKGLCVPEDLRVALGMS